jgi:proton-dependent oligopeptide transporter, POT family
VNHKLTVAAFVVHGKTRNTMSQNSSIKIIFLTELWERFSYYGITALLILYIAKFFHLPDSESYAIYGAYGALVYTTPMIGGVISDRFLGTFKSIVIGALLITAGHFVIMIPETTHRLFFLGLSLIITGTGLFKPSISAIIGQLYKDKDPRRTRGYTLAYIGSNIGTIIAPIVCAFIAVHYSWTLAFGVAGIGMLIGLFGFLNNYHHSPKLTLHAPKPLTKNSTLIAITTVITSLILISAVFFALFNPGITGDALIITGIGTVLVAAYIIYKSATADRKNMITLLILTGFYIIFMVLLQQSGGVMNLFTQRHVDRTLFGYLIPTGMFQSVEPLALVTLGLLWTRFKITRALNKKLLGYRKQFSFALIVMGASFLFVAIPTWLSINNQPIAMSWINVSYVVMALGELFIGPIGLAMVSERAPREFMGFFMGLWVLASAFANLAAAKVGMITSSGHAVGQHLSMHDYANLYFGLAALGIVSGLVLKSLHYPVKAQHNIHSKPCFAP